MKVYHYIFIALKIVIILLIILNKIYENDNSHYIEDILEDLFTVFVGLMMIFFFWPYRKEVNLDKHDKLIALSAGTLLLITKNYKKLMEKIKILIKNVIW
tara:strand:+ start:207 stop:506 length:300 start_codon:yes stop_codon:yes gene_type:complete